jgi:hypothetical protein
VISRSDTSKFSCEAFWKMRFTFRQCL